jgi:hypothetical protein
LAASSATAPPDFDDEPLFGRTLNYNDPPFVHINSTDPSRSFDMTAVAKRRAQLYKAATKAVAESWEQASLHEHLSNGDGFSSPPRHSAAPAASGQNPSVQFASPANQYYELGPSLDSSSSSSSDTFKEDRKSAAKPNADDDRQPAANPDAGCNSHSTASNEQSPSSRSDNSSHSFGASSEGTPYGDLICFGRKISWRTDKEGVKWPVYSSLSLSVKELKEVLSGRSMPTLGKKEFLIKRLENKDKRSWMYQKSLESAGLRAPKDQDQVPDRFKSNLGNFIGNIDATRSRSDSATSAVSALPSPPGKKSDDFGPHSKSLPPAGRSKMAIDVELESASESGDSQMSVDSDAVEMFPKSSAEESEEIRRDERLMC